MSASSHTKHLLHSSLSDNGRRIKLASEGYCGYITITQRSLPLGCKDIHRINSDHEPAEIINQNEAGSIDGAAKNVIRAT